MKRTITREAFLLWTALFSIFCLTHKGYDASEGRNHYAVAKQIVTRGALGFAQPMEGIFTTAPNGRTYASHEIGNTLFQLPVAALNVWFERLAASRMSVQQITYVTEFLRSLMASVYAATTVIFLYLVLRTIFMVSLKKAVAGCMSFALCTFFWAYASTLFDGVLCSTFLMGAVWCLFTFRRTGDLRVFVAAMLFFGFGVITRLSMVLPLMGAWVYLLGFQRDQKRSVLTLVVIGAAVLAPFAIWQMYYNHLRTGSFLLSPVQTEQYATNNALDGALFTGLSGLLFSPGKSVFVYCPLALLSLFCILPFWKKFRPEAVFTLTVTFFWFLLHAKLRSWYGAWGWGPRHFLTISPLLALPFLACGMDWFRTRSRQFLVVAVLAWGLLLSICSVAGNWYFRMALAIQQGRLDDDDFVWSFTRNQSIDMIQGAVENFRRMMYRLPYDTIPGMSETNHYMSNTVNIWLNGAYHNHVPVYILAPVALILMAGSMISFAMLWRSGDEPNATAPFGRGPVSDRLG